MNIKKFLSEKLLSVKTDGRIQKVVLMWALVLAATVGLPVQAFSSPLILNTMDTVSPCVPDTIPFREDFDAYPASGLTAVGVIPDCWTALYSGTNEQFSPHVTDDAFYGIENKSLVIFSSGHVSIGGSNYIVFPEISSDLNGLQLSFKAAKQDYTVSTYKFSLGYFAGETIEENFVLLEVVPVPNILDGVGSFQYSLNGRNIPQGARLAFQQQGGTGTGFYAQTTLDSIAIDFLPCAPVTEVHVSDVMMTTAHVAWTPGAWETAWQVEYGESGFTPGTGMVVNVDTVGLDLAGLDGETNYDVYVRAACDPANLSDYSGAVSFYTYCSVRGDTSFVEVCDRYEWRDSVYTESGTYYDTVPRAADAFCDSIYTLELTIYRSVYRYDTLVLCQDELPYPWADTTFEIGSVDGTFYHLDTTVNGCDSTVELALFINPSYYEERFDTICENDLPYQWNDTLFDVGTTTGSYVLVRHSQFGCDSIVTLHLLVNESFEQMELLQVCSQDLPVEWRDTMFYEGTESGVFVFHRYSQHGCDSVVTLALYVTKSDTVLEEDTICVSQLPYTWGDTTFEVGTVTGDYFIGGDLSNACKNTILHLVVGGIEQDINHPDTLQICRNDLPYVWHGAIGDYTFEPGINRGRHRISVTAGGCTDIYYVFVDLLENGDEEVNEIICSSQLPFTKYDTTFLAGTQSGTYYVTRPAANGCDKRTTIHLTVNPAYTLYDTLTICDNKLPYKWRGNEWIQLGATTGDYTYRNTTRLGCDSVVYLHLTVNRSYSEVLSLVVCENDLPVEWRGHVIPRGTTSQTLTFDETSVTGCDSVVMLNLTVNPTYRQEEELTICSSDLPFEWRDTAFDEGTLGGTYLFEKHSIHGCDSTVVLHLTVNQTKEEELTVDICRSELPFTWRDTTFASGTNSGIYIFHKKTTANCDSTVTLTLNIHESFGGNESLVVCENELPVVWRGNIIPRGTLTGNIIYREQTSFGCDSIVILSVVVNPAYHQNEELTICENELPYTWRDTTFMEGTRGGSFYFNRHSINGCDSTVMLKLTVHPKYSRTEAVTICDSELPYVYGDTTFTEGTESGTFTLHRTTENGCDSTVMLKLTVHPTYALTDTRELCESELPYVYGDTVFEAGTQSGTFVLHRRTRMGCDSIITLSMTVHQQAYQMKEYGICSSELPYVTEDTTFPVGTVSGLYNIYRTQHGCDSLVAIRLTVFPVYSEGTSEVICENDLPYTWRDTVFQRGTHSGVFQFARTTQAGCDSIVTLALIVNPSYDQEESEAVCANGFPFVWRDTTFYAGTQSGDFTFFRHTVNGCDSVVTLHLTVHPTYNQSEQLSVCQNELPYQWRDTTFQTGTPSGFYTFHRSSVNGCDSIVTLALTVYPSSTQYYNVRICSNDLPYTWNVTDSVFEVGTVSGTYYFHYTNVLGCDSNIVLNLTVNQSYEMNETLTLCQNELPYYYEPGNHTFSTSTTSGAYTFTHPTASGCDSTIVLYLTVHPSYLQQEMVAVCENDFPFEWRDTTFLEGTTSGTYVFHRTSQFGCDSVVSLILAVSPLPSVSITQIPNGNMTTLVCSSTGNCSYLWSTGDDVTVITVPSDSAATYSVTATNNSTGCSNSATVTIAVGIDEYGVTMHDVIVYPNPTDGIVNVNANNEVISEIRVFTMEGKMVKRVKVAAAEVELHFEGLATGTYLMQVQLQQGDVVRKKLIVR